MRECALGLAHPVGSPPNLALAVVTVRYNLRADFQALVTGPGHCNPGLAARAECCRTLLLVGLVMRRQPERELACMTDP
ncbi:hypothetical protein D3C76_1345070 [compost metagenome]